MLSTIFFSPIRAPQRASGMRYGAPLMLSVPPQTMISASPAKIERAPSMRDFIPEPHTIFTV